MDAISGAGALPSSYSYEPSGGHRRDASAELHRHAPTAGPEPSAASAVPGEGPATADEPTSAPAELDREEQRQVDELRRRDREVRAHEQAHLSALGPYAQGGAGYEFERGPDGRMYAVDGEVQVDVSADPAGPEETLRKAQAIQRAALAPQDPSAADRRVHAEASRLEQEAQAELRAERRDEIGGTEAHCEECARSGPGAHATHSEVVAEPFGGAPEPGSFLDRLA